MICGICSEPATHYFATVSRGNAMRCQHHADQFGYPQYLVEINPPKPAIRQPGYVIQFWDGSGNGDEVAEIWPFEEELSEWWVQNISACDKRSAEWLVGDAAYHPYEAQFLEAQDVHVEVTRVTCLPLVQV
ncbi:hypothetical protein D854_gp04 [Streptomyces phage R4]|uniref:Uncharacterized protein n=1 Tax=Streptomyces phage R4 TaxID=10732 RepID=K4HYX8_9CAUD|nr:hypothetical protein D854_gp04 [Streptomyces phage R4]AFU62138.1 hypothetical protein R4_82 [Streptomyces phage R4]